MYSAFTNANNGISRYLIRRYREVVIQVNRTGNIIIDNSSIFHIIVINAVRMLCLFNSYI